MLPRRGYYIPMMTLTQKTATAAKMATMSDRALDRAALQARMSSNPDSWALADMYKAEATRRIAAEDAKRQAKVRRDTSCTDAADRPRERPNHRIYDAIRDMDRRHDALMTD